MQNEQIPAATSCRRRRVICPQSKMQGCSKDLIYSNKNEVTKNKLLLKPVYPQHLSNIAQHVQQIRRSKSAGAPFKPQKKSVNSPCISKFNVNYNNTIIY